MGSNMAEAHPVGFQWVMEAKARGTQVVHIDPRFTRTSAVADTYVPLRAGTDIAFLGGVINYILSNELDFREYVTAYTNASFIVDEDFQDTEDLDGLFCGYDHGDRVLRPVDLALRGDEPTRAAARTPRTTAHRMQHGSGGPPFEGDAGDIAERPDAAAPALRLPDPQAALRPLHAGDGRGDLRRAAEEFLQVADDWAENSGRERTPRSCTRVAGPSTRSACSTSAPAAIIQLLLGNMGRPGGGIMAMRGHASIQGSTDIPDAVQPAARLPARCRTRGSTGRCRSTSTRITGEKQKGFWRNADAYMVSLLKEYWGDAATADNDFCFDYLPRLDGDHGTYRTVMDMVDGRCSATSCSGRTRRSARRTAGCSGSGWPTSTGWWSATSR